MTGPTVAPERRDVAVTRAELLALGAAARGESTGPERQSLAARGLLAPDGRIPDVVAATADAIGSPLTTVRVTAVRADGERAADLWLGRSRAVLHPPSDAAAPLVSVSRSLLPQLLVRATGLGPRPVADGPPFRADGATVAAACRGTAAPPWPGTVERPSLWRVAWRTAEGEAGDPAVLDLGPLGYWRPARGEGGELTWTPVRSAAVWQALAPLFAVTVEDRTAT